MQYDHLTEEQQAEISAAVTSGPAPIDTEALLPAWEADHAAHVALLKQAKANGDSDAAARHTEAMKAIESAIADAKA